MENLTSNVCDTAGLMDIIKCEKCSQSHYEQDELKSTLTNIENSVSVGLAVTYAINAASHLLILYVTLVMTYRCAKLGFQKTAFHAWFCTLGFIFLMSEGIMMHYKYNIVSYLFSSHEKRLAAHIIIQTLGCVLGIVGTIQKSVKKSVNFQTRHGQWGIAACVFSVISLVTGAFSYNNERFRQNIDATSLAFIHKLLATATFLIGIVAQNYGYETGFFRRNFGKERISFYKFLTVLILIFVLIGPTRSLIKLVSLMGKVNEEL